MPFNDQPDTANPPDDGIDTDDDTLLEDFLRHDALLEIDDFGPSSSSVTVLSSSFRNIGGAKEPPPLAAQIAAKQPAMMSTTSLAASQTAGPTLTPPAPPGPPTGNNNVTRTNPFRNINPLDVSEMDKLVGYVRSLANEETIFRKLSEMARHLFGQGTRKMTSGEQLQFTIKRLQKEAVSDDGKGPGPALLNHNQFDWKLNLKTATMPDDTKLPHHTDPSFGAKALEYNTKRAVANAGLQQGFVVARKIMAESIGEKPSETKRAVHLRTLFTNEENRVWERANGKTCTAKVNFRSGPRLGTLAALDDAMAMTKAVLSDDELKEAIGAPEDAIDFEAVAAARKTFEPLEDGDVATASKSAFAAFAIATAALECAIKTEVEMPWSAVPDSEKKRLLAADLGVGEDDAETRAKKLHKAAGGDAGLIFFYLLRNGNKL